METLAIVLVCPLVMGLMMLFMMRGNHRRSAPEREQDRGERD